MDMFLVQELQDRDPLGIYDSLDKVKQAILDFSKEEEGEDISLDIQGSLDGDEWYTRVVIDELGMGEYLITKFTLNAELEY